MTVIDPKDKKKIELRDRLRADYLQAPLKEIADTGYSGPMQQSRDGQTEDAGTRQGFSIDKTRDPFAGEQ